MEQNSCANCAHFINYYIKESLRYKKINNGHCGERTKLKTPPTLCEHWQSVSVKQEKNEKSLKKALQELSRKVNKIATYLSDSEGE